MDRNEFLAALERHAGMISEIRQSAHELHDSVNQTYGEGLPYGYHLDMVGENAKTFGHEVCVCEDDVVPMMFGAYYHDSIEDARQTYNDVMKIARRWMPDDQALMATEIVYALTNDKGRNRAERAGERYYAGIRTTPYAPFTKMCDRLANITFSCSGLDSYNDHMREVYKSEVPHFLASIRGKSDDLRLTIPDSMVERMAEVLIDEMEREEWKQQIINQGK